MSKPNKDGWIRHRGGKCPVSRGSVVEVRYRAGDSALLSDDDLDLTGSEETWLHVGDDKDIMAWRRYKPEQVEPSADGYTYRTLEEWTKIKQDKAQSIIDNTSAKVKETGQDMLSAVADIIDHSNPLQWRDRIREIDSTVEALEEERVNLVQKLEAEGFRLIDKEDVERKGFMEGVARAYERTITEGDVTWRRIIPE